MNKVYFEDMYDIAKEMIAHLDECNDADFISVGFIGSCKECAELIKEILVYDAVDGTDSIKIADIELNAIEFNDEPYYIGIDPEYRIWVEPALYDGEHFLHTDDICCYVRHPYLKGVMENVAPYTDIKDVYMGDEKIPNNNDNLKIIKDFNNKPCGFVYDNNDANHRIKFEYWSDKPLDFKDITEKCNQFIAECYNVKIDNMK